MKKRSIMALVAGGLLAAMLPAIATAQGDSSAAALEPDYDWDGRLAGSSAQDYDWDGRLAGSSAQDYDWDGRLAGSFAQGYVWDGRLAGSSALDLAFTD